MPQPLWTPSADRIAATRMTAFRLFINQRHGLALAEPLNADYDATLKREYPQLGRYQLDLQAYARAAEAAPGAQLWLVDPHGNLVLRYPAGSKGKAILDDLRYLLKISLIG